MKLLLLQMVLLTQDHLQDVFMTILQQVLQMVFVMLRMATSNLGLMENQHQLTGETLKMLIVLKPPISQVNRLTLQETYTMNAGLFYQVVHHIELKQHY